MTDLKIMVRHHLTEDEVLKRVKNIFSEMEKEEPDYVLAVKEKQGENQIKISFNMRGIYKVKGYMDINPYNVRIILQIPTKGGIYTGDLKSIIEMKLHTILARK